MSSQNLLSEDTATQFTESPIFMDRSRLVLVAFIANLGAFLLGYDYGASVYLLENLSYFSSDSKYSSYVYYSIAENSSVLLGLITCGAVFGCCITYGILIFYGQEISKKDEILLASLLYFIGGMLESFSYYISWKYAGGLVVLILGRFLYGAGMATSFHSAPQYVAEISPPDIRGSIGSSAEVMVGSGVVLGYTVGYVADYSNGWAQVFLIGYLIALLMGSLAMLIPHSPYWMARHNFGREEILEALRFFYPFADEESVTRLISQATKESKDNARLARKWQHKFDDSMSPMVRDLLSGLPPQLKILSCDLILGRCLSYGIWMACLNTGTGHQAILYYAGNIFDAVCTDASLCVLGLGFAKLLPAILMTMIADAFPRRHLLFTGTSIMFASLMIICIGYSLDDMVTVVLGMYLAVIGWEIGFGTMIWIVINELFPVSVRSGGYSLIVFSMSVTSTILLFLIPTLKDFMGYTGIFGYFTVVTFITLIYMYLLHPEAQGMDIEQPYKTLNMNFVQVASYFGYKLSVDEDELERMLSESEDDDQPRKLEVPLSI